MSKKERISIELSEDDLSALDNLSKELGLRSQSLTGAAALTLASIPQVNAKPVEVAHLVVQAWP